MMFREEINGLNELLENRIMERVNEINSSEALNNQGRARQIEVLSNELNIISDIVTFWIGYLNDLQEIYAPGQSHQVTNDIKEL